MRIGGNTRTLSGKCDLASGDRMTQKEFHRLYRLAPPDFKAELIGGIVYVSSPVGIDHGTNHLPLGSVFFAYQSRTDGVECGDNTAILLGDEGEPQPDLFLRILPEYGGQSRTTSDNYIAGAPELLGEITHSSRAIDLHAKRDDYARYGVLEYLVLTIREKRLRWFDLQENEELSPDSDGVYRIRSFPGLWIHGPSLFQRNHKRLMQTLQKGLESPEHAAFVAKLAAARKSARKRK